MSLGKPKMCVESGYYCPAQCLTEEETNQMDLRMEELNQVKSSGIMQASVTGSRRRITFKARLGGALNNLI